MKLKAVPACFCLMLTAGCSNNEVEERLMILTGNEYLAMSQSDRSELIRDSLARYTTWRFWDRPELCEYVLNVDKLAELYEESAGAAGDNLLAYQFVVIANDECLAQGEVFK